MRSRISDKGRSKQKRGLGTGKDYEPWIKIHDFSSKGLSTRIRGIKSGRTHHLLSQLETRVFQLLDFSEDVVDIREQYPLDLGTTLTIAKEFELKHPAVKSVPIRMTTDFFVKMHDKSIALSVKPSKSITNRVAQKFAIESKYWSDKKVSWHIITEKEIPMMLMQNIERLRGHIRKPKTKIPIADFLLRLRDYTRGKKLIPIKEILKAISVKYGETMNNVVHLYLHLVFEKRIVFDYTVLDVMSISSNDYEVTN
jgi:hypothetical protein